MGMPHGWVTYCFLKCYPLVGADSLHECQGSATLLQILLGPLCLFTQGNSHFTLGMDTSLRCNINSMATISTSEFMKLKYIGAWCRILETATTGRLCAFSPTSLLYSPDPLAHQNPQIQVASFPYHCWTPSNLSKMSFILTVSLGWAAVKCSGHELWAVKIILVMWARNWHVIRQVISTNNTSTAPINKTKQEPKPFN